MKITLLKHEKHNGQHDLELLFERETGAYNNVTLLKTFLDSEVEGLSDNEIRTKAIIIERQTVLNCLKRVEPCDEIERAIGFDVIQPEAKKIYIYGPQEIQVGTEVTYSASIFDQYGSLIQVEPSWVNKTVKSDQLGIIIVSASTETASAMLFVQVTNQVANPQ